MNAPTAPASPHVPASHATPLPAPSETAQTAWIAAQCNLALATELERLVMEAIVGAIPIAIAIRQTYCRGVDSGLAIAERTKGGPFG